MSLTEEIERLRELRDRGTLTEDEFRLAKAKLLNPVRGAEDLKPGASSGLLTLGPLTDRQWAVLLHLSQLLGFALPVAGFAVPILIWLLKKETVPTIDEHGRNVINWLLSSLVYGAVSGLLTCLYVGFLGLAVVMLLALLFPVIAAIKAHDGIVWRYPLSIRFVQP